MEDLKKLEELFDHAREYLNIRVDEVKLGLAEKESAIVARIVATTIVNIFFLLVLLFAGVASALALGNWWRRDWQGITRTLEPASLAREALTSCTTWIGKKFFSRQHSK